MTSPTWTPEELEQFAKERLSDEDGFVLVRESDAKRRIKELGDKAPTDEGM